MPDDEALDLVTELDLGGPSPGPKAPSCAVDSLTKVRTQGAAPRSFHCEYARDLTEADIAALSVNRGTKPRSLVRIHASHHALARCLASGMKPAQAALVTGYSNSRISILQNDEAFKGLVEDYRNEAKAIFADMAERMSNLSLDALELIQERLHEDPGSFTVPMLLDVVKAFADRTGHGPGQEVQLKVSQDFVDRPPRETFEEWEDRRKRSLEDAASQVSLDITKVN